MEDIVEFLLNFCVSFTNTDMDEEIVKLPPKPTNDIKPKSFRETISDVIVDLMVPAKYEAIYPGKESNISRIRNGFTRG